MNDLIRTLDHALADAPAQSHAWIPLRREVVEALHHRLGILALLAKAFTESEDAGKPAPQPSPEPVPGLTLGARELPATAHALVANGAPPNPPPPPPPPPQASAEGKEAADEPFTEQEIADALKLLDASKRLFKEYARPQRRALILHVGAQMSDNLGHHPTISEWNREKPRWMPTAEGILATWKERTWLDWRAAFESFLVSERV